MSEKSAEQAFWSVIDDCPGEDEQESAWFWNLWGHAEQHWRE